MATTRVIMVGEGGSTFNPVVLIEAPVAAHSAPPPAPPPAPPKDVKLL